MFKRLRKAAWLLQPSRVHGFLRTLPKQATILDVGCGSSSAARYKRTIPSAYYVGLDVGDWHQTEASKNMMDEYLVVPSEEFASAIEAMPRHFDAVISSHNIEHCEDPPAVLEAMIRALKPGGRLYMAFPSEASAEFPSRAGTLNFFDDPTHRKLPSYQEILQRLRADGLIVERAYERYRPALPYVAGALLEPYSATVKKVDSYGASWAFWGFESLIWARREA